MKSNEQPHIMLSKDEKNYIRGIISKTIKKCVRDESKKNKIEQYSIDDPKFNEKFLAVKDHYDFYDNKVKLNYNINKLTASQKANIIKAIDSILKETSMSILVNKLDSTEKIIIYLLYEDFNVKKIAKLLKINEMAVYYQIRKVRNILGDRINDKQTL